MIQMPTPREWQAHVLPELSDGWKQGLKSQLLCAPTGAGKTILSVLMLHAALINAMRRETPWQSVFLVDRTVLIDQTSANFDRFGLSHGVIQADHWRRRPHERVQVASVQTIANRGFPRDTRLIIVDECHVRSKTLTNYLPDYKGYLLGLTATPFSKGLGAIYQRVVNATTMEKLIGVGQLVPLRVFQGVAINTRGLKKCSTGEFKDTEVAERGRELIGDVLQTYIDLAHGKKGVIFCPTIAAAEEVANKFTEAGIQAASYCADTGDELRKSIMEEFQKPDSFVRILTSVEALGRGLDVQDIEYVGLYRVFVKSFSSFVQAVGRGARSYPGKEYCIVADHGGNFARFAEDYERLFYHGVDSLDDSTKLDSTTRKEPDEFVEEKGCPRCGTTPFRSHCINVMCRYETPAKRSLTETLQGDMVEMSVAGGAKGKWDSPHLLAQVCEHWDARTRRRENETDDQLARRKHWRAAKHVQALTGRMPTTFDFAREAGKGVGVPGALANKLQSLLIAYAKAQK